MSGKNNAIKLSMGILMLVFLVIPQLSYAYWGVGIDVGVGAPRYNYYYHYNEHPQWGWHIHYLPAEHITLGVHGMRYHYYDGLYYRYIAAGDYVLVQPPIGAYVSVIPPVFQPVIVNGRTYYTDHKVFYILTPHRGYRVVRGPVYR